jgi:hypothetical protein
VYWLNNLLFSYLNVRFTSLTSLSSFKQNSSFYSVPSLSFFIWRYSLFIFLIMASLSINNFSLSSFRVLTSANKFTFSLKIKSTSLLFVSYYFFMSLSVLASTFLYKSTSPSSFPILYTIFSYSFDPHLNYAFLFITSSIS